MTPATNYLINVSFYAQNYSLWPEKTRGGPNGKFIA